MALKSRQESTGGETVRCAACWNKSNQPARHRHFLSFLDESALKRHLAEQYPEEGMRVLSIVQWYTDRKRAEAMRPRQKETA